MPKRKKQEESNWDADLIKAIFLSSTLCVAQSIRTQIALELIKGNKIEDLVGIFPTIPTECDLSKLSPNNKEIVMAGFQMLTHLHGVYDSEETFTKWVYKTARELDEIMKHMPDLTGWTVN